MKVKTVLSVLLTALMLGVTACAPAEISSSQSADVNAEATVGQSADTSTDATSQQQAADGSLAFTTINLDGSPADQSIFDGYTLTMVNVWDTFCGPCLREMPELGQLAADYADKGVQLVGVVCDVVPDANGIYPESGIATARQLVAETGANYPHLLYSEELEAVAFPGMDAVPTTFFVDGNGNIVGKTYVGSRSGEDWAVIVDEMLAEVAK